MTANDEVMKENLPKNNYKILNQTNSNDSKLLLQLLQLLQLQLDIKQT